MSADGIRRAMGFHAGRNIDDPRRGNVRETVAKRARSLKKLKKKTNKQPETKISHTLWCFFFSNSSSSSSSSFKFIEKILQLSAIWQRRIFFSHLSPERGGICRRLRHRIDYILMFIFIN